jgi:hypothetical protein
MNPWPGARHPHSRISASLRSALRRRGGRFITHPHVGVLSLYGVIAIALLAPMASNTVLPRASDHANHVATIVQAHMAIDEGQFPIRVAPWEHDHRRYPAFQFYSPLPYTVGGLVYRWVTPENPFLAYKIVLWGALLLAGYFTFLAGHLLSRSPPAALLAGVMYMSAPYVLVNVHARGAFTEVVAQAILPAVVYYSLRCYFSARVFSPWLLAAGIAWSALALTHNITYVSSAAFVGALFVLIAVERRGVARGLWQVGAAFGLGVLLACYFLAPVIVAPHYLRIHDAFGRIGLSVWLTPIATLLSPISLPSQPQPAHPTTEFLNPAVGWPMLLGVGIVLYSWRSWADVETLAGPRARRVSLALIGLFAVALLLTWSPVDFWSLLPVSFGLAQFTYRFLSQVAWIGALISVYGLILAFRGQPTPAQTAGCLLLIVLAHSSFLPPLRSSPTTIAAIRQAPDLGYGRDAYLVHPRLLPPDPSYGGNMELSGLYARGILQQGAHVDVPREYFRGCVGCLMHVRFTVSDDAAADKAIAFYIDGKTMGSMPLNPVKEGKMEFYLPFAVPLGDASAPSLARFTFGVGPVEHGGAIEHGGATQVDTRSPVLTSAEISIMGMRLKDTVPVHDLLPHCGQSAGTVSCQVAITGRATNVQLPILFYPDLLDIRADGQPAPYFSLPDHGYVLASVRLEPGVHELTARFVGLRWANLVSSLAWMGTIAAGLVCMLRRGARARDVEVLTAPQAAQPSP